MNSWLHNDSAHLYRQLADQCDVMYLCVRICLKVNCVYRLKPPASLPGTFESVGHFSIATLVNSPSEASFNLLAYIVQGI